VSLRFLVAVARLCVGVVILHLAFAVMGKGIIDELLAVSRERLSADSLRNERGWRIETYR
jgi:hypothetical protein